MRKFFWGFFNTRFSLLGRTDRLFVAVVSDLPRVAAARHGELETAAGFLSWPKRLSAQCRGCRGFSETTDEKLTFDQVNVLFAQGEPELIFDRFEEAVRSSPTIKDQGTFPSGWAICSFAVQWRARTVKKRSVT